MARSNKEGDVRKIGAILAVPLVIVAAAGAAVIAFRRNPRIGSAFVNTVVNPLLLRRGLVGGATSELGTLEHVGRTSGIRRLTPVHPEPTAEGFRIVVPLGPHSQWAQNVLAAGHCRLQLHETVYELDEPTVISAGDADSLPRQVRSVMGALGFQYLRLRTFASGAGRLEPVVAEAGSAGQTTEATGAVAPVVDEVVPAIAGEPVATPG
jgi:deazaflavin-dependent oxidoreductase (nitroreductase family)